MAVFSVWGVGLLIFSTLATSRADRLLRVALAIVEHVVQPHNAALGGALDAGGIHRVCLLFCQQGVCGSSRSCWAWKLCCYGWQSRVADIGSFVHAQLVRHGVCCHMYMQPAPTAQQSPFPTHTPFAVHSQVFSKYKSSITGIVSISATLASSAVRSLGSPHQLLSAHLHARYDMLVWQTLVNSVLLGG